MLAAHTGIAPQDLWDADPQDLATLASIVDEQQRTSR